MVVVVKIIARAELVGRVGKRQAVEMQFSLYATYREHCGEHRGVGLNPLAHISP